MSEKVLVAGALGLSGRAAVRHFEELGWEVIGLSRRSPEDPSSTPHLSVDLASQSGSLEVLSQLRGISRIVYCALYEQPSLLAGWSEADHADINLEMLRNLLDAVEPDNPGLRHVTLLQGAKAYGIHLGPAMPPSKESAPRHLHPNFYWAQEDFIRTRSAGKSWNWTVLRPQGIVGLALGSAMNLVSVIGVYAVISRELGLPLIFPGTGEATTLQATDARLLAEAIAWAGGSAAAANQIFNVTNGDVFTWRGLWPRIAKRFGMEIGLPQSIPLATAMADKAELWTELAARHGLRPYGLDQIIGQAWQAADFAFSDRHGAQAQIMSTIKIRQAGFGACLDTEKSFDWWLAELQRMRILPQ